MLTTILRRCILVFLLNDYIKTKYPEKYQNFILSVSYNFFYFLSKLQIMFMKFSKKIEENPKLLQIKNDFMLLLNFNPHTIETTEYIKNGEHVKSDDLSDNNFDFILYSWFDDENDCVNKNDCVNENDCVNNNNCVNKKIMYEKNDIVTSSELSEIKFMLIEINIGENNYKIDLKTDRYNFYVVGNVLTKQFFIYYLKRFLKVNDLIYDKISIKIIDQNVNIIAFDFTDKNENIVLEKNSYKLMNCK